MLCFIIIIFSCLQNHGWSKKNLICVGRFGCVFCDERLVHIICRTTLPGILTRTMFLHPQSVTEASYVNIPVIAFCNTDSPLEHVDLAIPCNNKGALSIGLMWWMLAREVLRMRGTISRMHPWDVMPDLYFYRDPEDVRIST